MILYFGTVSRIWVTWTEPHPLTLLKWHNKRRRNGGIPFSSLSFYAAPSLLIFQGLYSKTSALRSESTSNILLGIESLPLKEIQFHLDSSLRHAFTDPDDQLTDLGILHTSKLLMFMNWHCQFIQLPSAWGGKSAPCILSICFLGCLGCQSTANPSII